MSVIRPVLPWRRGAVVRSLLLSLWAALALAACSSSTRPVTGSVGVSTGVALATANSVTELEEGTTLQVTASVVSDVNNAGVTWSIVGQGTLTDITTTSATYNAPASVAGSIADQITATSIADSTANAEVTLVVDGTPVMDLTPLFPANVNVPYGVNLSVAGGEAPFAWTLIEGTLPAGLTFNGSGSGVTSITGTATAAGTFPFTAQAVDTNGSIAFGAFTLIVNPQASCLLQGRYAFLFSGFRGGGGATHAGSITVDANGNVTGEQDYKDGNRSTPHEILSSGTCANRETNSGVLTLNAPSGTLTYNFSVTPPDTAGVIHSARLQLINSGSDSGSGELALLNTTALTTTPPSGNFAFGLVGVTSNEPDTVHFGSVGRFTVGSSGTLSAGLIDSNASAAPLSNATLTGTLSAPDSYGRGTAILTSGSQTSTLAYYIVNANKMYLIEVDPATPNYTPRATGYLTAQSGDASDGSFDDGALASPSILSLWGGQGTTEPVAVLSLGRLSNANAAAGVVDAVLDTTNQDANSADTLYSAQPYTIGAGGRGTLTLSAAGVTTRSFVFYLDATADGYILEPGSSAGSAGLLEAQYIPSGGIYPNSFTGFFVGGTQFASAPGPIDLIPLVSMDLGTLSSTNTNGLYAIDPASGRGFGSLTESGVQSTDAALYVVSPTKIDLMRFSTRAVDGTIDWFVEH